MVKNERIMTNYSLIPRLFHTASDGKLGGWGTGSEAEQTVDGIHTHAHTTSAVLLGKSHLAGLKHRGQCFVLGSTAWSTMKMFVTNIIKESQNILSKSL